MIQNRSEALYSTELLALAVELARFPYDPDASHLGSARSRTCGSEVLMSLRTFDNDTIESIGLRVSACAVGQAAASIFAQAAPSMSVDEISSAKVAIAAWLAGSGDLPKWPRFEKLEAARAHTGRHGALMLPWRAALDALSKD